MEAFYLSTRELSKPDAEGSVTETRGKYLSCVSFSHVPSSGSFFHSTSPSNHMALSQPLTPPPLSPMPLASDGHQEAAVASPAQYPGSVSATASREESQHRGYQENLRDTSTWERRHSFTIPCGLSSCSLEVWQNSTCEASLHYYTWDRCNYL